MARWIAVLVVVVGCGARSKNEPTKDESPEPFSLQAERGAALYATHCASCHGAQGEGGKAPRLVGIAQGALPLDPPPDRKARTTRFRTAADVGGFVMATMPPEKGGSISAADYLRVLAFSLKANGVDLGSRHLDVETAATLVLRP